MGMPAKQKVKVVGQGFDPNDERFGAKKDAFGVTVIPADKGRYDAWQVAEKARIKEEKARTDAQNIPDLTSGLVKAAVGAGYRDLSIARRSRANSFQTGASAFANQGIQPGILDNAVKQKVLAKDATIKVTESMAGLTPMQKAKKAGF